MDEVQDATGFEMPVHMLNTFSEKEQYTIYPIKKKSGGVRMIEAPSDELKEQQKASLRRMQRVFMNNDASRQAFEQHRADITEALTETIDNKAERAIAIARANTALSDSLMDNKAVMQYAHYAHAFCYKRNIASGAEPHVGAHTVITADLTDFFPSIKFTHFDPDYKEDDETARKHRSYKNPMAYVFGNSKMAETGQFMQLYREYILPELKMHFCDFGDGKGLRLPQGAPASPFLSNVLLCRFDYRAGWKCYPEKVTYTRYADDLILSGADPLHVKRAYAAAVALLSPLGLQVNKRKYTFKTGNQRKKVLGLVVNVKLNTTRYFRRRNRAAQHHCRVIYTLECLGKERGFKVPTELRPFLLSKTEGMSFGAKMNKIIDQLINQGVAVSMDDLQSKKLKTPFRWLTRKIQGHSAFQHMVDNPPEDMQTNLEFCQVQEMLSAV